MRLTRKNAIKLSIKLWVWLTEDGSRVKGDWPEWDDYREMNSDCFLCEYDERKRFILFFKPAQERYTTMCAYCPYAEQFGRCTTNGSPYDLWEEAVEEGDCKGAEEAAAEFLKQLEQLV